MGLLPFAVAFIVNAGSDTDGNYEDSMADGFQTSSGQSKWLYNGGENWSWYYDNLNFYPNSDYEVDCIFIVDGICEGKPTVADNELSLSASYYATSWRLPMNSQMIYQSHFSGSNGNNYVGSSGSDIFGWRFGSEYLSNMDLNTTVDKMRFTFANPLVSYSCGNSVFTNLTFDGKITFDYQGERLTFSGFEYEVHTEYKYDQYSQIDGTWSIECVVGFDVEFDFTGFESLEIEDLNQGYWNSTAIEVELTNFVNEDSEINFGQTVLPFAGDNFFWVGIEHQEMDVEEAGFIIRLGTLALTVITFVIAIASTPYWNPFKNFFRGI